MRKGSHHTEASKRKMSESQKVIQKLVENSGRFKRDHIPWNKNKKDVQVPWNKDRKLGKNPEHSRCMNEYWKDPEYQKRLSEAHIGLKYPNRKSRKCSIEHKNKISESLKKYFETHEQWHTGLTKETDERVRKLSLSVKRYQCTEEARQEMRKRRMLIKIPHKDTSIEIALQESLRAAGVKFETHKPILGQPDMFIPPNICVFADGDYWHNKPVVRNRDFWNSLELKKQGYVVLRFWGHEIRNNIEMCVAKILMKANGD